MAAHGKIQEYNKIQSNYVFLTEDLKKGIDGVIRSLFNKGIIDDNHKSITDGDTRPKVEELLDILMYSGEGAYDAFIETLKELKCTEAVAKLEQGDDEKRRNLSTATSSQHQSTDFPNRDHRMSDMNMESGLNRIHDTFGRLEKKREPMKKEDLNVFLQEYPCLLQAIELHQVQPFLLKQVILDRNDTDRLSKALKEGTREEVTGKLLDIVMYQSGSDAFPRFVKCLYDAGYPELANKLQPSVYF